TGFVIDFFILLYLLTSGSSIHIRQFAEGLSNSEWVRVAIYAVVITAVFKLFDMALGFVSDYWLEHRFGLSRQSLTGWMKDELKALGLSIVVTVAAVEVIYTLLRNHPDHWWIYASLAFIAFVVVMTNLAPVLLLPLFYKFRPVENPDLQNRVARLARLTNTSVCGIFEWALGQKTRKANAAVVGWGNTRRIIVSDTLLENFSGEEIEVIMAHELCHHVKHHIWLGVAVPSTLTIFGFYGLHPGLPDVSQPFGFRGPTDIANFPLVALSISVLSLM